jgi:hypothetical protein
MAVKNITHKKTHNKSNINRADQVSTKNTTKEIRGQQNVNVKGDYAITLQDIDETILGHINEVMAIHVPEANKTVPIPTFYSDRERWVEARRNGVLKDKNGTIQPPFITFKRNSIEKNDLSPYGYEHDIHRKYGTTVVRSTSKAFDNRYTRFSQLYDEKPVKKMIVTSVPDYVTIPYDFMVWTAYIEQMNIIQEAFIEQSNKYWGYNTAHKFLSVVDSISNDNSISAGEERLIKSTFTVTVNAYLLPEYINSDITKKISQIKSNTTTRKVVFGSETVI